VEVGEGWRLGTGLKTGLEGLEELKGGMELKLGTRLETGKWTGSVRRLKTGRFVRLE
jgi:hypothetical protein